MSDKIELEIVNIVASGVLGAGEIDTSAVGKALDVDEINVYPGRVYVSRGGEGTFIIYRKGTYSIAGSKSYESLRKTVEWMSSVLEEISVPVDSPLDSLEVKYIVYTADLERELNLETLAIQLGLEYTEYEPEQFPGVLYRNPEYDCTVLLFASGKVVITGTRSKEAAHHCLDDIFSII